MNLRECHHHIGEEVGPYRLERLLGQGASAEVWLANEQGELGFTKRQALKLLRPPPGDIEGQKKALINEARVCGRLKHPGLVDVYRVGEHAGELFIAMEYVEGSDLNSLMSALRRRAIPFPVRAGLEAAINLAEALEHAHTRVDDDGQLLGIVHRDLKPSNVLVDRAGTLKISDWGLVKSSLNIESTTRGVVKGTPGYIAPEVWGGTRDFKPTADLFALGAMLYEMIVGERLFRGKNLARIAEQVARRKPDEEAARVRERCPELEVVLTRMLQRAPGRRYSTAEQFSAALRPLRDRYPSGEGITSFLLSVRELIDEWGPIDVRLEHSAAERVAAPVSGTPNLAGAPVPPDAPSPLSSGRERAENASSFTGTDLFPAVEVDVAAVEELVEDGPPALKVDPNRRVGPSVGDQGPDVAAKQGAGVAGGRRRRPLAAPRRSGPSVALGLGVAFLGLVLLGFGLYAYWGGEI